MQIWLSACLCLAFACGTAVGVRAQDEPEPRKRRCLVTAARKGTLSHDDREAAAKYLSRHAELFREAPDDIAHQLEKTGRWTDECASYASRIPDRLARKLSEPREWTYYIIFDRALLLIRESTSEVVDRVDGEDD